MATKETLLTLLQEAPGVYRSGQELARILGVSRAAVNKAVKTLRSQGCHIDAVTNKGYALLEDSDIFHGEAVMALLPGKDWNIQYFPSLPSTNSFLKELASQGAPEGTVIAAGTQTAGRGRMGRSFYSPRDSGLYLSLLLRPQDLSASESLQITTMAASALCLAIEHVTGKAPQIKWVNDLFLDGRKICGILTEASLSMETGRIDYAVLGLGLNLYAPPEGFPEELKDIAGALCEDRQPELKNRLTAEFLKQFSLFYQEKNFQAAADCYRSRSMLTGKTVMVGNLKALVLDVNSRCQLMVRFENGKEQALSYGEVSIVNYK